MWFLLAFLSAILGGIDVVLNKKCLNRVSAAVLTWSLFVFSTIPIVYVVIHQGIPITNNVFYFATIGSSITFVFSKTIVNNTLKNNLISRVFPLTALAGVFTYIFGLIFLSESIRVIPVVGILATVIGSYILNTDKAKDGLLEPFKALFANRSSLLFLLAILLNSITTIFDKTGLNNTSPSNPSFTLLIENFFLIVFLTPYLIKKEKNTWKLEIKNNLIWLIINGIIYGCISLLIFAAYTDAPVALVMAIKRLQIFFVLLFSWLFFHDRPTKHAWIASVIMVFGILLIKLG